MLGMPLLFSTTTASVMMTIHTTRIASLITAVLASGSLLAATQAVPALVFDGTTPQNDLQGSLAARVQFAQSQILPAHPREGDNQPRLTALRKSLLLVRPMQADSTAPMVVMAYDGTGKLLGSMGLNPPSKLPKTAYYLEGSPEEGVDFTPGPGTTGVINSSSELAKLGDPAGAFLLSKLRVHALVSIQTADGRWVRNVYLPTDAALEGKMVRLASNAGYDSTVTFSGRQVTLSRGQSQQFKFVRGQWIRDGELENNGITYASDAWSGVLPSKWIVPGLSLWFSHNQLHGELTGLKVGAPGELLIHTIDIGMLTTPRNQFAFAKDPEAHREYFQTIPASRLIVSQYAPLSLPEVMLPDGTLLTDFDPSEGGWHDGTMRQRIGKELISHGIDNANYGINSTAGEGESSHPYVVAQLAAHNSRGKYANGVKVHGGSGGGGIVTLDASLGNEFSHEVGHNYGLGHYVGALPALCIAAPTRTMPPGAGMATKTASFPTSSQPAAARAPVWMASVRRRSTAAPLVSMPWLAVRRSPVSTVLRSTPPTRRPSSSASSRARRCLMPVQPRVLASGTRAAPKWSLPVTRSTFPSRSLHP